MKLYKDLFIALLPIIGLVIMGLIAYILFNVFPSSEKSEYDDIQIFMVFWMSLIPVVLAFLAIKNTKTDKD